MLQLVNQTPFSASLSVLPDTNGVEGYALCGRFKATFALHRREPGAGGTPAAAAGRRCILGRSGKD